MARYRLIAGSHQDRVKTDEGFKTRDFTWNDPENCIVDTDDDLVAKYGRTKFENLDGPNAGMSGDSLFNQQVEAEVKRRLAALGFEGDTHPVAKGNESGVEVTPPQQPNKPSVFTREELEGMTNSKLRSLAESSDIDVSTANNKDELVNCILAAT